MESTVEFPWDLAIADFDYQLPKEKIALYPLEKRDHSKLLIYKEGTITDSHYYSISEYVNQGSLMIFNESKVIHARLQFVNEDGALIEVFCLEPADKTQEINRATLFTECVEWRCLVGDLRKWKDGLLSMEISTTDFSITLKAELLNKEANSCIVKFYWDSDTITFAQLLTSAGKVPLPPYIKRGMDECDKTTYQTTYAKREGSVAAPTAGLHFTPFIFDSLRSKGIDIEYTTLHVGAGTFKPVKAATMDGHIMHSEQILLDKRFLNKLEASVEKEIIAVGTTSARTLESIYWLGVKIYMNYFEIGSPLSVDQWDPYTMEPILSPAESIKEVIKYIDAQFEDTLIVRTSIIIAPGYKWHLVDVLATNFHQPKSTLILLIASFVGDSWKLLYKHAINNDYRFLSYGDGALLFRKE